MTGSVGGTTTLVAGALVASAVVMGGATVAFQATLSKLGLRLQKKPIYPADGRTLSSIPIDLLTWERVGRDHIEEAEVQETLGTDNYVTRLYVRKTADEQGRQPGIRFHAAYYTGLIDTVPHVPERCFVGGGLQQSKDARMIPLPLNQRLWSRDLTEPDLLVTRASDGVRRVRLPRDPEGIELRVSEFDVPGEKPLRAGYFFIANGGWKASAESVRLLAFNLHDEYAYYMKVQFTSSDYDSAEEFAAGAAELLDEMFGDLMLCVPDWVRVMEEPPDEG